jgi:hypothetical protein
LKEKTGKKTEPDRVAWTCIGKPEKLFHNNACFINFWATQQTFFTYEKYPTMRFLKT